MKILLDENIPIALKSNFSADSQIFTVNDMGWNGKANGELLRLLVLESFDMLVTIDKNLPHRQNMSTFPLKLVIFNAYNNKIDTLLPYIQKFNELFENGIVDQITLIDV